MDILELKERHPKVFQGAYETWLQGEGDPDWNWYDQTIKQAVEDAKERGFYIDERSNGRGRPALYFSGFWSQGDGSSWTGYVDVIEWIEWMKKKQQEYRSLGIEWCKAHDKAYDGNGTPFSDMQLLWLQEAFRNDVLPYRVIIGTGRESHSGSMRVVDSLDYMFNYVYEIEEGIFKGMDSEEFEHAMRNMFDGTNIIEKAALAAAREFADEVYSTLEKEYEYLTSEEYFIERMQDDARRFDKLGNEIII
jgi:hypothetical protein